jgi:hypothetical protein
LVAGKNCEVLNLVAAGTTAVSAVVANQGAVAEEQEIRIRVEESMAGVTPEAIKMPTIVCCSRRVSCLLFLTKSPSCQTP